LIREHGCEVYSPRQVESVKTLKSTAERKDIMEIVRTTPFHFLKLWKILEAIVDSYGPG
jgi:hypothetical protein